LRTTATVDYDTTAWKRSSGTAYEVIRKKAERIVLTSINETSTDGKTITMTTKGVDASERPVHNVRVYDKR
jgi:DNA-binding PadR family transcriptional regulator